MLGTSSRIGRRVVTFAGGRGGIGRSVLAANIGVYLAQLGKRVVLVDADLGGASQHTILGLERPKSSITQMIDRRADHLVELIVDTPVPGLYLLPGAADRFGVANLRPTQKERLLQQFRSLDADFVLLDAGSGTSFNVLDLFLVADFGVLLAVPEPTAVEAVYRFVKSAVIRLVRREVGRQTQWPQVLDETVSRLGGLPGPLELRDALSETAPLLSELVEAARQRLRPRLVVNRTKMRGDFELAWELKTLAAHHLGVGLEELGSIESDDAVWLSVRNRRPLVIESPGTQAAKGIEKICRRILSSVDRVTTTQPPPRPVEVLNHYEVLDIDIGAREDEIRRGFKRMRELYSPDRLAGYSLAERESTEVMRGRIQEAYETLLDPKSRRDYDLALPRLQTVVELTEPGEDDVEVEVELAPEAQSPPQRSAPPLPKQPPPPPEPLIELHPDTEYTGAILRQVRETKGVELREITARTKIGTSYLKAIEDEDFANLPAMVYTRGFVGEMAKYLELDHQQVVKTYIKRYQKYLEETGKLD